MTGNTTPERRKRPFQRGNFLNDIGRMLGVAAHTTGKAEPLRRKTVLTPPIIDLPCAGPTESGPTFIASARSLPADPFDDPPGLGIWFSARAVVRVPEMAAWFNETAKRAGLHVGMVCSKTNMARLRGWRRKETAQGAVGRRSPAPRLRHEGWQGRRRGE